MYVGHFVLGIALKTRHRTVRALPIMLGIGFIDILDGLFTHQVRWKSLCGP